MTELDLIVTQTVLELAAEPAAILQVVEEAVAVLVAPAAQGPAGVPGTTITKTALSTISGHVVVKAVAGGVDVASSGSPLDIGRVIGITTAAAQAGASVAIQIAGEVVEPTWAWIAGSPVFLGLAGALTQTPPTQGILQQIGVSTTPISILVDIQTPFMRA